MQKKAEQRQLAVLAAVTTEWRSTTAIARLARTSHATAAAILWRQSSHEMETRLLARDNVREWRRTRVESC